MIATTKYQRDRRTHCTDCIYGHGWSTCTLGLEPRACNAFKMVHVVTAYTGFAETAKDKPCKR